LPLAALIQATILPTVQAVHRQPGIPSLCQRAWDHGKTKVAAPSAPKMLAQGKLIDFGKQNRGAPARDLVL